MELQETLNGLAGILRPFKKFLMESGLSDGDQIVFYGCPGTCTPFVELLGFAIRDLPFGLVFIPYFNEKAAKVVKAVPDVGMQVSNEQAMVEPTVAVLMGGLSMPNVPVTVDQAKEIIAQYDAIVIGVCFMNMFERAGWTKEINFDFLIDATIEPVKIWK